jgi:hypothetical protein
VFHASRTYLFIACCCGWSASIAKAQENKPLEWRLLLIMKTKGDIRAEGFPEIKYEMSKADIEAVKTAFTEFTPAFVKSLSHGRIMWTADAVVSATPLPKVAKLGDGNWVSLDCVQEDFDKYVPPGKYDGVIVYWKGTDDTTKRSLKGGFGWTHGATDGHGGVGYSCVNFVPARDLGRESEWTEVFLHEWLHQVEAFYGARGVKLPRGGLHGNDNYGFKHKNGWKHWYEAFINTELTEKDGSKVGLGEAAWRHGTFRDEQVNLSVWSGFEASKSLLGTKEWTYQAVVFGSGDRTEVEVGARLGHHGSTATGTVWLDDLVLIEIPGSGSNIRK